MPWITIDRANVHYTVRPGGSRAMIFLHGGFGSSSELWSEALAALPADWTGYAIDNFLRSDPPPDGYNVAAFARRTAGFVRALGLDRPVLAGHSMGGVVCQITAIDHPQAVGGLVLVCTGASMTNHQLARDLLDELRAGNGSTEVMRAISAHWFYGEPPQPFFDGYVVRAVSAPLSAMIDVQASLIATDQRDRLSRIAVPALVVFGAHDTGRTIEHAQMLVRGIRGSELATMTNSGHSPMVETPIDFNMALHAFLRNFASSRAYV
jgi:pimeloyl-ACP methyl ester carboxylesterase